MAKSPNNVEKLIAAIERLDALERRVKVIEGILGITKGGRLPDRLSAKRDPGKLSDQHRVK